MQAESRRVYVCMYVCMYVCIYIYIYSNAILAKFRVYVVEKTSLIEVYIGITVI